MPISRRDFVATAGAVGVATLSAPWVARADAARTLKISHQFPGGTIDQGDFRDRMCRMFAREIEARSKGALRGEIYPDSSLMKTNAQFSAMRKGALDLSLYPMPYAGGEVQPANLGLMPCLVTNYDQAAKWKAAPIGEALTRVFDKAGIVLLSWVWQAGGVASRGKPVALPDDVKGIKIRGGSREMDMMFAQAGGQVSTMASNEIYIGMQTGALDAAVTSSTSLISFRLEELSKALTTGRGRSFWFMCEPLMMSKAVFQSLTPAQQTLVRDVGAELEAFGFAEAKKDDEQVAKVYGAKGAQVIDLSDAHIAKWQALAEATAWKDFAAKSTEAAELMGLAQKVA